MGVGYRPTRREVSFNLLFSPTSPQRLVCINMAVKQFPYSIDLNLDPELSDYTIIEQYKAWISNSVGIQGVDWTVIQFINDNRLHVTFYFLHNHHRDWFVLTCI